MKRRFAGLAAALLLLAGCEQAAAPEAGEALRVARDSTGDVPVVRSYGRPPAWRLDTLLAVGSVGGTGGPAPDEFGLVTSVLPGPANRLWVADAQASEIRVFDESGALALQFGRRGEGPGEFGAIYSLAWVQERLLVLDLGNGRVGVLSREGEWLGTRPAPGRVSGSPAQLRFYPVSDSLAVQWSLATGERSVSRVWIEHGPDGVRTEWRQLEPETPESGDVLCERPDGALSFFRVPFGPRSFQLPAASREAWVGWSADYRLARIDAAGDTVGRIERVREPEPISDAEWAEAHADFAEFRREWPGARCRPSDLRRPDVKAAYRNVLPTADGSLWVEVHAGEGTVWEIFDASGALIGTLPGFDYDERVAPQIRSGRLAWVTRDSLGVQRALLARVVREPVGRAPGVPEP